MPEGIGAGTIIGVILVVITVAIGSTVGLTLTAKTQEVYDNMALTAAANSAMSDTVSTIYSSWPLLGIVVLALIAAAALAAIMILR